MKQDSEIVKTRRTRLQQWINDKCNGKQATFIEKTNMNQGEVSALLKDKSFGEKRARGIEALAGMPEYWLDKKESFETNKVTEQMNSYEWKQNTVAATISSSKVPLISEVQAGEWCEAIDNYHPGDAEEWLYCPVKHSKYTYALRVVGDSMTNPYQGKSYPEGTIIFVDPEKQLINGCRVVAKQRYCDKVTFKEYREDSGKKYLKPLNPQYDMIEINDESRICGVVIFAGMAE